MVYSWIHGKNYEENARINNSWFVEQFKQIQIKSIPVSQVLQESEILHLLQYGEPFRQYKSAEDVIQHRNEAQKQLESLNYPFPIVWDLETFCNKHIFFLCVYIYFSV